MTFGELVLLPLQRDPNKIASTFHATVVSDRSGRSVASLHGRDQRSPLAVLPTATGKSLIVGQFAADVLAADPAERIAIVTHVKELDSQDSRALLSLWPDAPCGILSAGLGGAR